MLPVPRRWRASGKNQRFTIKRTANNPRTDLSGDIHTTFQVFDAPLTVGRIFTGYRSLQVDPGRKHHVKSGIFQGLSGFPEIQAILGFWDQKFDKVKTKLTDPPEEAKVGARERANELH
ncbi:hypothetical protein LAB1_57010 [Roseibium sp. LAB1]